MTVPEARALGYEIRRGSYVGTTDDCIEGWYIDHDDVDYLARRGPGYRTRREALDALQDYLELAGRANR